MSDDLTAVTRAFSEFDGRHVAPLRRLADGDLSATARGAVLAAIAGPDQIAATWIIKHWAENGAFLPGDAAQVFAALPRLNAPDAILHVLQMVQMFPEEAVPALPTIRVHLKHRRVLVRTWALDAFVRCGPRAEAEKLLNSALKDASAAVRARARQLQAAGYRAGA
ncbi:MAG: hypothetical protein AAF748_08910 [Pseudomonadota bacterium]